MTSPRSTFIGERPLASVKIRDCTSITSDVRAPRTLGWVLPRINALVTTRVGGQVSPLPMYYPLVTVALRQMVVHSMWRTGNPSVAVGDPRTARMDGPMLSLPRPRKRPVNEIIALLTKEHSSELSLSGTQSLRAAASATPACGDTQAGDITRPVPVGDSRYV